MYRLEQKWQEGSGAQAARFDPFDRENGSGSGKRNGRGGNRGNRRGNSGGNGNGGNNNGKGDGDENGTGSGQPRQNLFILLLATVILFACISYFLRDNGESRKISYNEFVKYIQQEKVTEVDRKSDRLEIHLKDSDAVLYTGMAESEDALTQRLMDAKITYNPYVPDSSGMVMSFLLSYVIPILLMWGLLSLLFRRMGGGRGGLFNVGKSTAKEYVQKETGVTFKDVAGEDEAKESLVEVVDFLHNPGRYVKIGARLPKGALLVGPPGTGKTLLAKAVAGEAHVPFFSLTGSDFIELYVGVGASRVRDLFKEANKNAPCIIFIDEIDAIGRSRDSRYGGGNEEREQTLNQLLSEMDGFEASKGILIIGATNRPEILDKALLRPGRFDRRIIVDRPDLKGRVAILKVHAKDVKMDETVDLEEIALATSGAVGSDLANMINEAAINAVKDHRQYVCQKDLFEAVEQVLVGKEKKDRIMSKEERRIVSYHEVGHALISAVQKNSEPVQKITIVPRTMGALGYVMQVPEEEKYLNSKAELEAIIIGLLGGRAAEELKFESVTTGASNDIERATALARNMVTQYGMSDRFGLMGLATVESQYLEGRAVLNCSDVTAAAVDEEVRKILEQSYAEAKRILSENMDALDTIADFLIREETITGKEFMQMFDEVRAKRGNGDVPAIAAAEDASDAPAEGASPETAPADAESASPETTPADAESVTPEIGLESDLPKEGEEGRRQPELSVIPLAREKAEEDRDEEPAVPTASVREDNVEETAGGEENAEETAEREDDDEDDRLSPEELVRRSNAPKGRYSQVSLEDLDIFD
ncbi:MAG: ATP-dependent zinc metalloprotease FtsH [Eubacteriales bacterium]|nr:ATP-dependent zinc metalloprotease FtsH [Eubacteriales bacterium]